MLTKGDLEQIDMLLQKRLGSTIDEKFVPMEKRMGTIEKLLKSQGKKLDLIISFFDRHVSRLAKKVARLEEHAGFPPFE